MPKYRNQPKVVNREDQYSEVFENRGVKQIRQYLTKYFNVDFANENIECVEHPWSKGDRYYKLAYQYYNSYDYWWIIAIYNGKPTEAHIKYGQVIKIPTNLSQMLSLLGE